MKLTNKYFVYGGILFVVIFFVAIFFLGRRQKEDEIKMATERPVFEKILEGKPEELPEVSFMKSGLDIGVQSLGYDTNPLSATFEGDRLVLELLYEGLAKLDARGRLIPALAESWIASDDGLQYTVTLRKNLDFSDGSSITYEDIVTTYQMLKEKYDHLLLYEDYQPNIQLEGKQLIFNFSRATDDNAMVLMAPILKKDSWHTEEHQRIGAGPYQVVNMEQEIVLISNSHYYAGQPQIPEIRIRGVEPLMLENNFNSGQLDLYIFSGGNDELQTALALKGVDIYTTPNRYLGYMGFNLANPALSKLEVRKAMAYGLDRSRFIQQMEGEYASIPKTLFIPTSYIESDDIVAYPYDFENAEKLLEKAGWKRNANHRREKNGELLTLRLLSNSSYLSSAFAETLKHDMEQLGITIEWECLDHEGFIERLYEGKDFDLYFMYEKLSNRPEVYQRLLHPNTNIENFTQERALSLLREASNETNEQKKEELYRGAELLIEQEIPKIPIISGQKFIIVNSRLRDFEPDPFHYLSSSVNLVHLSTQ